MSFLYCCLRTTSHFHCQFHLEEFSTFFVLTLDCCNSSNFLGGTATEIGLVTTFLDVPNFLLLSQHRRAVIIDELIKLTMIMVMKVKNKIPEVLDKVTHMHPYSISGKAAQNRCAAFQVRYSATNRFCFD